LPSGISKTLITPYGGWPFNQLIELVRQKLAVPGNERVDVSATRLVTLRVRAQVYAQLKPVLRAVDFAEFDLDRAFASVAGVAAAGASQP
jgi:hypothetical protein